MSVVKFEWKYVAFLVIGLMLGAFGAASYLTMKSLKTDQSPLFWTSVGTVATCIGSAFTAFSVLVAAWSFASQARRAKASQDVAMLLKLSDEYDSPRFQKARASTCVGLQADPPQVSHVVIDFFEQVGLLERYGLINTEFVWHKFYYPIFHYYHLTQQYREEVRKSDSTVWDDFESLYTSIAALQEKRVSNSPTRPTKQENSDFLAAEVRFDRQ
ncbi:DUF4760 domain-containing protein [Paraburkholderia aspalathi]|uniref:DUF4760 domain-containing protein n=1 Tax=Paraburkholderia aspalathi TaxID=1324617 RepID=UPI0038BDE9E2